MKNYILISLNILEMVFVLVSTILIKTDNVNSSRQWDLKT